MPCNGLQHSLAAADDRQEWAGPFVMPVADDWFGARV